MKKKEEKGERLGGIEWRRRGGEVGSNQRPESCSREHWRKEGGRERKRKRRREKIKKEERRGASRRRERIGLGSGIAFG